MRLAVVEILDRDGHARQLVPVWHWPVTDRPRHRLRRRARRPARGRAARDAGRRRTVELQPARRRHDQRRAGEEHTRPRRSTSRTCRRARSFQLGGTRLRVRRASDPLAPERALALEPANSRRSLLLLALALMAWGLGQHWLDTDPGARFTDYLPVLVGSPALLALWCFLWALGSKLFRHRFDFWPHARVAVSLSAGSRSGGSPAAAGRLCPVVALSQPDRQPGRRRGDVGDGRKAPVAHYAVASARDGGCHGGGLSRRRRGDDGSQLPGQRSPVPGVVRHHAGAACLAGWRRRSRRSASSTSRAS